MEPLPRQREPQRRCGLGIRDGDTRGPELALERGTTCGRTVAAHVPLAPTTAAGRFAQSPPAWHRLRRGGVRPPESPPAPLRHVTMLRTTFPEPMGVRIALVCTHRRTEREWERERDCDGGGSGMGGIGVRRCLGETHRLGLTEREG
jgi:hypothetical protein